MDVQNLFAPTNVRQGDDHLAVETAGALQRRVEYVGTVGCRNDDDGLVALKTVHFHQQLV